MYLAWVINDITIKCETYVINFIYYNPLLLIIWITLTYNYSISYSYRKNMFNYSNYY